MGVCGVLSLLEGMECDRGEGLLWIRGAFLGGEGSDTGWGWGDGWGWSRARGSGGHSLVHKMRLVCNKVRRRPCGAVPWQAHEPVTTTGACSIRCGTASEEQCCPGRRTRGGGARLDGS